MRKSFSFGTENPGILSVCLFWFWLLAQAAKSNDHGFVRLNETTPYEHSDLAKIFCATPELIEKALNTFNTFGMIEEHAHGSASPGIEIKNWYKYQNQKTFEDMREGNRERQRRYRESKRIANTAGITGSGPSHGSGLGEWDFALSLLSATGKIPGLNAGHLARIDAECLDAKLRDHIQEIVDELEGLAAPVQNSLQWLRSAAAKLAERNRKDKAGSAS